MSDKFKHTLNNIKEYSAIINIIFSMVAGGFIYYEYRINQHRERVRHAVTYLNEFRKDYFGDQSELEAWFSDTRSARKATLVPGGTGGAGLDPDLIVSGAPTWTPEDDGILPGESAPLSLVGTSKARSSSPRPTAPLASGGSVPSPPSALFTGSDMTKERRQQVLRLRRFYSDLIVCNEQEICEIEVTCNLFERFVEAHDTILTESTRMMRGNMSEREIKTVQTISIFFQNCKNLETQREARRRQVSTNHAADAYP